MARVGRCFARVFPSRAVCRCVFPRLVSASPFLGLCSVFLFVSSLFSVSVLRASWCSWPVAPGSVSVRLPPTRAARVSVVFAAPCVLGAVGRRSSPLVGGALSGLGGSGVFRGPGLWRLVLCVWRGAGAAVLVWRAWRWGWCGAGFGAWCAVGWWSLWGAVVGWACRWLRCGLALLCGGLVCSRFFRSRCCCVARLCAL